MNWLMAQIARRFLTKFNLAWVGNCEHLRSPDVLNYPLPNCYSCAVQHKFPFVD